MNKEVDKYMSRANQDIQWCEDRHSLKVYIAGLLEIIDGLQEENKILTQQWLAHSTDNNHLQQQLDQTLKGYEEQLKINEEHQKLNGELREEIKSLEESLSELSQYKMDREEEDMMNYLIEQEEVFNDYIFMEE